MFKEIADIQTADMLEAARAGGGVPRPWCCSPRSSRKKIVASLSERAEKVRNKQVDSNEDKMPAHYQRWAGSWRWISGSSTPCCRTATPERSLSAPKMCTTSG